MVLFGASATAFQKHRSTFQTKTKRKNCFGWKKPRPMYMKENISERTQINHSLYLLQEVEAYQILRLNGDRFNEAFFDEIYPNPPILNYPTNKKMYNQIEEIWIIHLMDMADYKISNNKMYR